MTDAHPGPSAGPERDFVGYGPEPPIVRWPGGALVAVNLVVNYEEGGEYSLREDGINDTWGEYSFQYGPEIRDLHGNPHGVRQPGRDLANLPPDRPVPDPGHVRCLRTGPGAQPAAVRLAAGPRARRAGPRLPLV